jgi:type IV secretory pathway VirJ component
MSRADFVIIVGAALLGGSAAAHAGPCTAQIADVERAIHRAQNNPAIGPTADQSVAAQLHHQPTPGSVQSAEAKARDSAKAALDRARNADAAGDAAACQRALEDAKELYGL